jgi:UDP-N-acetylmuramoylalanine--D-glutamate ligase
LSRVLVIGLGVTGDAVVRHRTRTGDDVTVVEDAPAGDAYRRRAEAARAMGAEVVEQPDPDQLADLVRRCDLLVPSPGVSERHPAITAARQARVQVRAEVDLAAELAADRDIPLVAVTGTNGKTTVTTLIAAMLEASGVSALAAGNIGLALIDAVDGIDASGRVLVAEVSSFQLAFTTDAFRPHVAVLLNVAPDHLDWHGSFERYAAAKAQVFANQRPNDVLVFNRDDDVAARLAARSPSRRVGFSLQDDLRSYGMDDLPLTAPHDRANALAAINAAIEVGGRRDGIKRALCEYPRLHHRVTRVGNAGGVQFYDDSKATNPHATLSAVRAFESHDGEVVLIAGGRNKGLDLSVLRTVAPLLRGVVAIGEAAGEVENAFAGTVPVTRANSMREAVIAAARRGGPGDVVLLSPACASFDWYVDYAARGDDFAREVARVGERGVA